MSISFGIIANPEKYSVRPAVDSVLQWISQHSYPLFISPKLNLICTTDSINVSLVQTEMEVIQKADFILSIGGDGTMLWTAQLMANSVPKPILGINSGRLGFMADTSLEQIHDILTALTRKAFQLDRRYFLETSHPSIGNHFALNEFLFTKKDSSSMIKVKALYNKELINHYWADGLIVSTPTGSTAYNLSSGGPIILPGTHVIILTPINPHTLTTRPLVIPSKGDLEIVIEKQSSNILFSYDGNNLEISSFPFEIQIKQSQRFVDIIELPNHSFFSTLRSKLMWGKDARD